ncbi:MAG: T9SS C-terminal target domain-containing protein [Crocinitomicaceae bacterium]|nr:T9SS C-terminal target domain-containing protein [Crocinitomicaceae bacterium]
MSSFTIRVAHTTSASYSNGSFISGTSSVTTYTGSVTTINGWNTYTFNNPFNYNQTMNLLITVSFNNNVVGTNSIVQSTILSTYKSLFKRDNLTSSTIASTAVGTQSYYRPNMRFKFGPTTVSGINSMQVQNEDEDFVQMLEKKSLVVYPNPMGITKRIMFTYDETSNQPYQVLVIDQMGRVVYSSENVFLNEFENSIELDKDLQQGNYMLRIQNTEELINERFTVFGD